MAGVEKISNLVVFRGTTLRYIDLFILTIGVFVRIFWVESAYCAKILVSVDFE